MTDIKQEPVAEKRPYEVLFGKVEGEMRGNSNDELMDPAISRLDNYYWLRSDDRKNEDVLGYLKEENSYTEANMADTKDLQKELYDEMISRVKEDYDSYPSPHGDGGWDCPYNYFVRTVKGKSYTIHCRINKSNGEEEVLLDENELAEGKDHCDVSGFDITQNHKMISYGVDEEGNETYKFFIKNLETGEFLEHNVPDLMYCGYEWYDNETLFYTMGDKENRIYQVWRYEINTKSRSLIYQVDDPLFSVGMGFTEDNRYLIISSSSFDTANCFYYDMKKEGGDELHLFCKEVKGRKYSIDYHEGNWFVSTNFWNGIKYSNFAIFLVGKNVALEEKEWRIIDEYNAEIYTKGISFIKDYAFISRRKGGNDYVEIVKYDGENYLFEEKINIPKPRDEEIYQLGYIGLDIYNTDRIWFSYSSMTQPAGTYEYNLTTGETTHLRTKEVPNYNADLYCAERIFAKSHDGTMVPMSLIYNKTVWRKDGSCPLYLYGYGSYGHTVHPSFSGLRVPMLDKGWGYVIAHVRGGAFNGYSWYEDGKMMTKMNTFMDFNACAEHLIRDGYTYWDGISAEGRSAGGLLMGAVMTMRPDLYHSIVAGVPFVDVMNTMCDSTIPLTTPEWEQWGNPNIKEFHDYMLKYSPYDNIKEGVRYPHLLALGGLNDPRVQYWEPTKFVAKLRQFRRDNKERNGCDWCDKAIYLLKIEMNEGHFSASDRYKYIKEMAYQYAFVLKMLEKPLCRG